MLTGHRLTCSQPCPPAAAPAASQRSGRAHPTRGGGGIGVGGGGGGGVLGDEELQRGEGGGGHDVAGAGASGDDNGEENDEDELQLPVILFGCKSVFVCNHSILPGLRLMNAQEREMKS